MPIVDPLVSYIDHIKISKRLLWLRPYLINFGAHELKIKTLKRITAVIPKKYKAMHHYGTSTYNKDEASITLMVGCWRYRYNNKRLSNAIFQPYTKIETLMVLAHELSHIKLFWDDLPDHHTAMRQMLECEIALEFMDLLLEDGYESEEKELRKLRRECDII